MKLKCVFVVYALCLPPQAIFPSSLAAHHTLLSPGLAPDIKDEAHHYVLHLVILKYLKFDQSAIRGNVKHISKFCLQDVCLTSVPYLVSLAIWKKAMWFRALKCIVGFVVGLQITATFQAVKASTLAYWKEIHEPRTTHIQVKRKS